jgi:acetyl-CoA carboxylase alpha subunit
MFASLAETIDREYRALKDRDLDQLVDERIEKFCAMGVVNE